MDAETFCSNRTKNDDSAFFVSIIVQSFAFKARHVCNSVPGGQNQRNFFDLSGCNDCDRLLFLVLLFGALKAKAMVPEWEGDAKSDLSEGLTKADSDATKERRAGKRISLATIRPLVPFTGWVKTIRHEALRILPLSFTDGSLLKTDPKSIIFAKNHPINFSIFVHSGSCRVEHG